MSNTPEFKWDDQKVLAFIRFTQKKDRDLTGYYSDLEAFKSQHSSSGREAFNWVVFTNEGFGFDTWSPKDWRGGKGENWDETIKTFLTKDEADIFVLMNKPCLSLNDIDEILAKEIRERKTVSKDSFREIWYTLKQLAQSKINPL